MIIWTIPQKITQGDRVTWTQNLAGFDSAFDTLSCFLRGQNSALDLTGVPLLLGGWEFNILEAQGLSLNPGSYKAQFVIFAAALGRQTLASTDLLVLPSFEALTTLETRSSDEIELEQITMAIARLASGALAEYRIGDRMMRYQDLEQLTKRQRELRNRIAMTKKSGNIGGRNVGIRFEDE
jgi:hypothetical protein